MCVIDFWEFVIKCEENKTRTALGNEQKQWESDLTFVTVFIWQAEA